MKILLSSLLITGIWCTSASAMAAALYLTNLNNALTQSSQGGKQTNYGQLAWEQAEELKNRGKWAEAARKYYEAARLGYYALDAYEKSVECFEQAEFQAIDTISGQSLKTKVEEVSEILFWQAAQASILSGDVAGKDDGLRNALLDAFKKKNKFAIHPIEPGIALLFDLENNLSGAEREQLTAEYRRNTGYLMGMLAVLSPSFHSACDRKQFLADGIGRLDRTIEESTNETFKQSVMALKETILARWQKRNLLQKSFSILAFLDGLSSSQEQITPNCRQQCREALDSKDDRSSSLVKQLMSK